MLPEYYFWIVFFEILSNVFVRQKY